MKQKLLLRKKIGMLLAILIFSVASAQAVEITYSLTTHVDGRTITGIANVTSGASLEDNMPQTMWRGYTTYTYYSDEAKTQKITTAPNTNATVYVDYVFDPPFILSEEGKDPVWLYFRNSPGIANKKYYLYKVRGQNDYEFHATSSLNNLSNRKQAYFAFYGDAYSLSIKFNDYENNYTSDFMRPVKTRPFFLSPYRPEIGDDIKPGWQLYENKYGSGYFSLQIPNPSSNNSDFLYIYDASNYLQFQSLPGYSVRDSHNAVGPQTANDYDELEPIAFVATPATYDPSIMDFWHVTYKILKAGGTSWYDDIVVQKTSSNLVPTWPVPGFTPINIYDYDYFYKDIDFSENEKWPDGTPMPKNENTVLYIREVVVPLIETPWMTLVLPFNIPNFAEYFGTSDAVAVDKYTSVDGQLSGSYFNCHLKFSPVDGSGNQAGVDGIVAGYPYLFKANHVKQSTLETMYETTGDATLVPVTWQDEANARGIDVSMIGVLAEDGFTTPDDGLHFYFASKEDANTDEGYRYGFVIRGATIPKNRCYFYVTDNRTGSVSPLTLSFDDSGLTGIGNEVTISVPLKSRIYNINGQLMNASSTSELPKGIYIVNGKKFIVK